jgi:hypothetical protein
MNKTHKNWTIVAAVIVYLLTGCGGGGDTSQQNPTTPSSEYISPTILAGYFFKTKATTQTTQEFEAQKAADLAKLASAKVIQKKYSSYNADTGEATFEIRFEAYSGYSNAGYLYNADGGGTFDTRYFTYGCTLSSSAYWCIDIKPTRDYFIFSNITKDLDFRSTDSKVACKALQGTPGSTCTFIVNIDRAKYLSYELNLMLDVSAYTLDGIKADSSSYSTDLVPINLNSVSIIDPATKTIFGTFYPL